MTQTTPTAQPAYFVIVGQVATKVATLAEATGLTAAARRDNPGKRVYLAKSAGFTDEAGAWHHTV